MSEVVDVAIVGGGPVGGCLAALLARAGAGTSGSFKVVLIEPKRLPMPLPTAPMDLRVVALSRASERALDRAGAWQTIAANRVSPYERMRVWHESAARDSEQVLTFDAAEVGEPNLGHIVENRLVQAALLDAAAEAGVRIEPAELKSVRIGAEVVQIETSCGELTAKLVVGADGANSAVRQAVGLTARISDYGQTAIVATIATERSHERTAWQRFLRNGTLAFLPLADGNSSIVWSADDAIARALLSASPEEFARELDQASDLALGRTRLVGASASFPLRKLAADRFVANRTALIGDAAHVVHPLAGQGVNLGLLDAATLADLIIAARAECEDPGALRVLRRYERWRKSETEIMSTAIDAFDRFLAHGSGPISRLAQRGLGWINRSQEAKRFFIRRALGLQRY
jgi:2-polyprenylphenol 6-hydroxylase